MPEVAFDFFKKNLALNFFFEVESDSSSEDSVTFFHFPRESPFNQPSKQPDLISDDFKVVDSLSMVIASSCGIFEGMSLIPPVGVSALSTSGCPINSELAPSSTHIMAS